MHADRCAERTRRTHLGVADAAALQAIAEELRKDRAAEFDAEGVLHSHDDLGIGLAFRVTRRRAVIYPVTRYNAPGQPGRLNARAPRYEAARPHEISHIAIGVDPGATRRVAPALHSITATSPQLAAAGLQCRHRFTIRRVPCTWFGIVTNSSVCKTTCSRT